MSQGVLNDYAKKKIEGYPMSDSSEKGRNDPGE
jgi:hypothetical protein